MKTFFLILLTLMFISLSGAAQSSTTKYFKDISLSKKACAKKANFAQVLSLSADGRSIEEVWRLADSQLVKREEYKLGEPFGKWIQTKVDKKIELDYEFELSYSDEECSDSIVGLIAWNYLEDQPDLEYLAPKLKNGLGDIGYFIGRNLIFPKSMLETGMEAVVVINLRVKADGNVENINISKPCFDVSMNKEAQRVIRLLKFSDGAKLHGKPVGFCTSIPIRFEFR